MNIGLVLSGGGARSFAHIGVIKALEENGIFPTHIVGTSAGAIVGSLKAAGVNWYEILIFLKTISIFQTNRYALNDPRFINLENFYNDLKVYLHKNNFDSLKKPLFSTAKNVIEGTLKIFSSEQLIKAVIASASFPGNFTAMEINGKFYIDGGTLNNFLVEPLNSDWSEIDRFYKKNYFC
jgi:NTE family protein